MKRLYKSLILASLFLSAVNVQGEVKEGYYDSLSGLNGVSLRKAVKNVVRNHTRISYGASTWEAFKTTDTHFVDGRLCWWDMYSNENVLVSGGHDGLNIEHSVAKSWWGGGTNDAYCDLFNLNPSNISANSAKSNYPLGEISNITWQNGVTFVGSPVSGQGGGNGKVYEPADQYKGDFARGFMYMFTVYDDISWASSCAWMFTPGTTDLFKQWAIELLLKWHRQDPVSDKEINRNEAVYKVQGNRNPFIDSPELAEYIWGTHKDQKYEYNGDYTPIDPTDPTDPTDPVDPDDPEIGGDGWVLVEAPSEIKAGDKYILVSADNLYGMSTTVAANNSVTYFKPTGGMNAETIGGKKTIKQVPADIAVLNFVASGTGYKANVSTLTGASKGWVSCTATKQFRLVESSDDDGTTFSMTISGGESKITFGALGSVYYNSSSPRFTTYTSTGQKATALYRLVENTTGVEAISEAASQSATHIFNLQGVEMHNNLESLPSGIYIVIMPGKSPMKIVK